MPQHTASELANIFRMAGVQPQITSQIFNQQAPATRAAGDAPPGNYQYSSNNLRGFELVGHKPGPTPNERELEFMRRFDEIVRLWQRNDRTDADKGVQQWQALQDWWGGASLQEPREISRVATDFFLPQLGQQYSPEAQRAVGGLRLRAARAGLGETPFALTAEAGLRSQTSGNMVREAFERALTLGQQRQSVESGGQALLAPPQSPYLLDLFGAGKEAFGSFATYKALQGQRPGVPFSLPQPAVNQFKIPNQQSYFPTLR